MRGFNYFIMFIFLLTSYRTQASTERESDEHLFINYDWMDAIVNQTPAERNSCPLLELDNNTNGFSIAREKSFFINVSKSGSRWFPKNEIWSSVGLGPIANNFGIFYTTVNDADSLTKNTSMRIPQTFKDIDKLKVSDAAYWESQGGLSFYLGAGVSPIDIGVFTVATGGWSNYLQKVGTNKVYVEISKKKINSISFGMGVYYPNISIEKVMESSHGFAYQFTLDTDENKEAFERFVAGDSTKAFDLSQKLNSGVVKISDLLEYRIGIANNFSIATPFIPILFFKTGTERAYDHSEENSVWDEKVVKDLGIYVIQKNTRIAGLHLKEARSFVGGKTDTDFPSSDNSTRIKTEKLFGNFKYAYQSDWGQERRLRKYINRAMLLTGLQDEICVEIPNTNESLKFNQVVLNVHWSDEFIKEIIGLGKSRGKFLNNLKRMAQTNQNFLRSHIETCNTNDEKNFDITCYNAIANNVDDTFKKLETYTNNLKVNYFNHKNKITHDLERIGEEVWKSPAVFKAFFEKGKQCGEEFNFEVSGQRITKYLVNNKYPYSDKCLND